jgi:AAA+ superfamily predicted ATPase
MLQELERYDGVVIFATNLAANFDPAFERRIRTHVLFELPGVAERERIWEVQLHPTRTPLALDVDFAALARQFEATGGEIRNAVLKAALAAAAAPEPDADKVIRQEHFVRGMEDVLAARRVMRQSIMDEQPGGVTDTASALQHTLVELARVRTLAAAAAVLAAAALLAALLI